MSSNLKAIEHGGSVAGRFPVPGSKSLTNRALVCAALAPGTSRLGNASDSEDTALMSNGLNQLGILVRRDGTDLVVDGEGGRLFAPRFPIPVGNAGTTFRFLLALAGLAQGETAFEVSERMAARPVEELQEALGALGIEVSRGITPSTFRVRGGRLCGGEISMGGGRSSQFISAVMMVAPYAVAATLIRVKGPLVSAPYVEMTREVMEAFGAIVQGPAEGFKISAEARYLPRQFTVEADASSATYGLAAAAIAGGEVVIPGLWGTSHQPDAAFLGILGRMGCSLQETREGVSLRRGGELRGIEVDMGDCPDAVPALAAVALFASGPTHIRNVGHLRHKESDRLSAIAGELRKIGAAIVVEEGGMKIQPGPLQGGMMETHNDHRLAMSFALIGLRIPGIVIDNPRCVAKSFPRFWEAFEGLRTGS
jgi:3-phosphoshikimate 1-carboxyvinyltransferase